MLDHRKELIDRLPDTVSWLKDNVLTTLTVDRMTVMGREDQPWAHIPHTNINDELLTNLAAAISDNCSLKKFSINRKQAEHCSFEWTEDGAKAIGEALKNHPAIKKIYLNLRGATLSQLDILSCLTGTADIRRLTLKINATEKPDFLEKIGTLLSQNKSLRSIRLKASHFLPITDIHYEEKTLATFANGLTQDKKLKIFFIKNLNIKDCGALALNKAFANIHSLKKLSLTNCGITTHGMTDVNAILANNSKLSYLDLRGNKLNKNGIEQLSRQLPTLPKLKALGLSKTGLDDAGVESFKNVWLQKQLKIDELDLSVNQFDTRGISAILQIVKESVNLKILNLADCHIKDQHVKQLEAILANPADCRLETISFSENGPFNKISYQSFVKIIKDNENICNFYAPGRHLYLPPGHHLYLQGLFDPSLKTNRIKKKLLYRTSQSSFITTATELAHLYYTKPLHHDQANLSQLPLELMLMIMLECGKNTFGVSKKDILQCCYLLLENFERRSNLISNGTYKPNVEGLVKGDYHLSTGIFAFWKRQRSPSKPIFRPVTPLPELPVASEDSRQKLNSSGLKNKWCLTM